jgi:selenocysteine lyase/cysteine desulfurase
MAANGRIDALVPRDDFLRVPEVAHLCAGGETPILRSHLAAVERFFGGKSDGMAGREQGTLALAERCRELTGRLLGVPAGDIAFLSSASEGIGQLVGWLDWRPGDNVVVEDIEFPSDVYPWTRLRAQGVEVRVIRPERGTASLDHLVTAMDARTRVLAVSQVSYLTGRRYRLEDLRALADVTGALLSVDATHAAGVVPVEAEYADVLVSSCYKFLLAVHGAAVFYRNPRRLAALQPLTVGWHSADGPHDHTEPTDFVLPAEARRFEAGNPPFLALAVLENALEYLAAVGIDRIEAHVLALGSQLWDALEARGLPLLTPRDPRQRGPNVCFAWPDPAGLVRELAARDVLVWGDSGRMRVSFHAYNDQSDIERLLEALDECLALEDALETSGSRSGRYP